jgi:hypothetical protein
MSASKRDWLVWGAVMAGMAVAIGLWIYTGTR